MIHDRMEKIGVKNMSAYIRKMAIDGYYIHIDFSELLEIIKLLKIDSNNINQIAKVANSCGTVDGKTISDMKENHERVYITRTSLFLNRIFAIIHMCFYAVPEGGKNPG